MFRCAICQETLDIIGIAAIKCGHTFHGQCILQWLERSKTCPSCRYSVTTTDIISPLYLECQSSASFLETSTLSCGELERQCLMLEGNISSLKEQLSARNKLVEEMQTRLLALEEEKRKISCKKEVQDAAIFMLREKCKSYDRIVKENDKLSTDNEKLRRKLECLEKSSQFLTASDAEAENILDGLSYESFEGTKVLLGELKRQLTQTSKKNEKSAEEFRKTTHRLKCLQIDCDKHKKLVTDLREEIKLLRTKPNQTPFNPALRSVLAETPSENQESSALSSNKRPKFLGPKHSTPRRPLSAEELVDVAEVKGQQSVVDKTIELDEFSPINFLSKPPKNSLYTKRITISKRPDGLGGTANFLNSPKRSTSNARILRSSNKTNTNATRSKNKHVTSSNNVASNPVNRYLSASLIDSPDVLIID